jgi:type II secretory pathway pseudopilin PulG
MGFTLVEVLVAAALTLFMMTIMTQAFVAAAQSMRDLKAAGDLAEKLRALATQLRSDLAADHFEGKKRLGDANFWSAGPPAQGFFRIYQGSRPVASGSGALCVHEGTDVDGLWSFRTADHMLHFTAKQRGNNDGRFFSAKVPAGSPLLTGIFGPPEARFQSGSTFRSQWAEVAYFLRPAVNDQGLPDTANGTPLYSLYRRQRLLVPENASIPPQPAARVADYLEVSCNLDQEDPQRMYFNNPVDVTIPARRLGTLPDGRPGTIIAGYGRSYPILAELTSDADLRGADLALTDVVSFDVRVLLATNPRGYPGPSDVQNPFVDLFDPSIDAYNHGNALLFTANGPRVFDTWSSAAATLPALDYSSWSVPGSPKSIPLWKGNAPTDNLKGPILRAIQITIRVWDVKTAMTRQITVVQAL